MNSNYNNNEGDTNRTFNRLRRNYNTNNNKEQNIKNTNNRIKDLRKIINIYYQFILL